MKMNFKCVLALVAAGLIGCDDDANTPGAAQPDGAGVQSMGGANGGGAGGGRGEGGVSGAGASMGTGGAQPCVTTEEVFEDTLWEPLFEQLCLSCHSQEGIAAGTRMVLVADDVDGWQATNLAAIRAVSEGLIEDRPLLLMKPTGRVAHTGGSLIDTDSALYAALEGLVGRLNGSLDACGQGDGMMPPDGPMQPGECGTPAPGRRLLRRLSHTEYSNTIRDLLGVDVDAKAAFVADAREHHFDNHPEKLDVSGLLAMQYTQMAETLSEQISPAELVDCDLAEGDLACAHRFIADFGRKMYRRPLKGTEIEAYRALFALVMEQECFEQGVRWVVAGMLQSPHFLYRTELGRRVGDRFELTPYELATSLSYLIWQTTPDETLLGLAADGQLLDPAVLTAQVERLIEDPRSVEMLDDFLGKWLGYEELLMVVRDSEIYAALYFELRESMLLETRHFIEDLWNRDAPYSALFNADHTYLDGPLSEYYGIDLGPAPANANGFHRVELMNERAGGILAQGAMMTAHASPTSSSPIHRGVFVREQLLCETLQPPPDGLDIMPPEFNPDLPTRERFAAHTDDEQCAGCHRLIDGIGFGFEHYDGIGRYRTEESGAPVDASGTIVRVDAEDIDFDGVGELGAFMAVDDQVKQCYTRQWLRFGLGETEGMDADCYVSALTTSLTADEDRFTAVLRALTTLPHFSARLGEPGELDVTGVDLVASGVGMAPVGDDPAAPPANLETPVCGVPPAVGGDGPVAGGPGLEVNFREDRWDSGYCHYYTISNVSAEPIEWAVDADVEGVINNAWNSNRTGDTGRVRFTGVEWNASVAPNQQVEFGFCAAL